MSSPSEGSTGAGEAGIAIGAALLAGSRLAAAGEPKLLVYLHVAIKQRALQGELQAALQGIQVTAVGRIADFERALSEGQDAVLTSPLVIGAEQLKATLRGFRAGLGTEKYSLVGADTLPDPSRVPAVGALDLLGRDATNTFVYALLGSKPRVERVSKVEDLLALLQMQRVEAVLLPSRMFADLQLQSRMNLVYVELRTSVSLPAVANVGSQGPQILPLLQKLPRSTLAILGVDEWR